MRESRRRLESGCQRGWGGTTLSGGASWNAPLQRSCAAGRMGLNGAGGAGLLTTGGWNHGVRGVGLFHFVGEAGWSHTWWAGLGKGISVPRG